MTTALAASRDYSRGMYRGGSRLARSVVQGDPGPSLFAPGTVTPAASIVKMAHALLAYGSQKKAEEARATLAAQEQEKSSLQLEALRHRADPNYRTGYQQDMLGLARERENRMATTAAAPKEGTPPAPVRLGAELAKFYNLKPGYGGDPEGFDPREVSASGRRMTELRLADHAKKAEEHAATKAGSRDRYTKAVAEIKQYDSEAERVANEAEAAMRTQIEEHKATLFRQKNKVSQDSLRVLRRVLSADNSGNVPANAGSNLIEKARLDAKLRYEKSVASRRRLAMQVIQREAGTLEGGMGDPLMDVQNSNPNDDLED